MNFSQEPPHSDKLKVLGKEPWNAEPYLEELIQHPITREELIYSRNHCLIKDLDASTFRVQVNGLVQLDQEYTLDRLRQEFPRVEVVAALQCAGNRRKKMAETKHREVEGLMWEEGTIANVRWGGARLRDVLLYSGPPDPQGLHVCFASHVTPTQDDDWFGASIPLQKALDESGDVLIAYKMNGRPLSADHGKPFRIVVPGFSGVRWVKWVDEITISRKESPNHYQHKDYKVLPEQSHEKADTEDWWSKVPPLQANPLSSVVASAKVESGPPARLHVKGYAVPGPLGQVAKVEITLDEGNTWLPAEVRYQEGHWSWTLWESVVELKNETRGKVWSRATDKSGQVQEIDQAWNLRGVAYSAIGEKAF